MFENLLSQDDVATELANLINHERLPGAMVFHGPAYAGKLTAALEVARSLTCRGDRSWSCGCRPCSDQRLLVHPATKLIGPRNVLDEISASADVLKRTQQRAAKYLYVRAVRKLLRRFDPDLWDDSDRRYRSVGPNIEQLNDLLDELDPATDGETTSEDSTIEETIAKSVELSVKVADALPKENTPVEQIRHLAAWANQTSDQSAKVAIIVDADRMTESSRNALLKILEEPPRQTYFILITASREALIPTIRSRVRDFRFKDRSAAESREVLERIFRESSDEYGTLRDFFLAWHISPEIVRNECTLFLEAIRNREPDTFFESNRDLETIVKDRAVFRAFMEQLLRSVQETGQSDETTGNRVHEIIRLDGWLREIRTAFDRVARFNINPGTALESLFYRMGGTA